MHRALHDNAAAQERLKELLWKLAEAPMPAMPPASRDLAILDRTLAQLAAAASRLPDAPAMLSANNRQVFEVVHEPDGTVRVLKPAPAARPPAL